MERLVLEEIPCLYNEEHIVPTNLMGMHINSCPHQYSAAAEKVNWPKYIWEYLSTSAGVPSASVASTSQGSETIDHSMVRYDERLQSKAEAPTKPTLRLLRTTASMD
ncbi:unnamed protein product [Acanthoscelides obtectus]|uniref:Uncharacterized protein n=1 Tax=Acanthoscelides obtectus TaxID=200917 RepID=A0A9P0LSD0_ACAOB|nr:unnamed protein product [Acanthoscelides obtectus]CAK1632687.1 hypothetical protein AOBTE_LOCUS7677 [Acanthoscelides obtectus]